MEVGASLMFKKNAELYFYSEYNTTSPTRNPSPVHGSGNGDRD
jgi:hypothetical protein